MTFMAGRIVRPAACRLSAALELDAGQRHAVAAAPARVVDGGLAGASEVVLRLRGVRETGHPHRHGEADLAAFVHDDLGGALAAQAFPCANALWPGRRPTAAPRTGFPRSGRKRPWPGCCWPAGARAPRARASARPTPEAATSSTGGSISIDTNANSRCSRVDRSTSRRSWSSKWARLYRPVSRSRGEAWPDADCLRSCSLACCCASSCSSAVRSWASRLRSGPRSCQTAATSHWPSGPARRLAQHPELAANAAEFDLVLGEGRAFLRRGALLRHAQRRRGLPEELAVGAPQQRLGRPAQPLRHDAVDVQPQPAGGVLDDEAVTGLIDQRRRQGSEPFGERGGQRERIGHGAMVSTGAARPRPGSSGGLPTPPCGYNPRLCCRTAPACRAPKGFPVP